MSQQRGPIHPGDEERLVTEMGRELAELGDVHGIRPSAGFADRVMSAIADEPLPQPALVLGLALRRRRLGAALVAIGDSWRVAFGGPRPFAVRAQALALVLVVTIGVLGAGGAAIVGASRLLGLEPTPAPSVQPSPPVSPPPSIVVTPSPSPSPSPSVRPTPSATPAETPDATETAEPTETPDESDDHGGGDNSGSGSSGSGTSGSDDSSGSGSGSDDGATPKPDDHTPEPTDD
jgi:uncharacterized membrane protein YgcG